MTARQTSRRVGRWHLLPSGAEAEPDVAALPIRLVGGPGFGDGTHVTTRVCLEAIAALAPRAHPWRMLDFGSGSGILAIAGARLGATVDAVEIDPRARQHAERNFEANGLTRAVRQHASLEGTPGPFDLVVANILRQVLVAFARPLAQRAPWGALVLSGLVSTDVPEVSATYAPLLGARPEVYERDEWRALVWRARAP
jgi:ribosomal protein L11 methyltransferase